MISNVDTLSIREARRLALARAGLLRPERTGLPQRAAGRGRRARTAAHAIIGRFGYLQLDTVSIAGARSHAIVVASRLDGFDATVTEELLQPGAPLFEYWGHEASWVPMELYPAFAFRRREFHHHPWWGDVIGEHPEVAAGLRHRIRDEGPLRSIDMEGGGSRGWWDLKVAKRVASALWSRGELAIRERRNFQRTYDLAERVIPESVRRRPLPTRAGLETLILAALDGHGWATTSTIVSTWRLGGRSTQIGDTLKRMAARQLVVACTLEARAGRPTPGWIRPDDMELATRLTNVRPRSDTGVLLSPFDPLLWDRARVALLFGFDQVLEIFKPAPRRVYGYYCLPVLAGERLTARLDLKANRRRGTLDVLMCRFESTGNARPATPAEGEATRTALARYAAAVHLEPRGWRP